MNNEPNIDMPFYFLAVKNCLSFISPETNLLNTGWIFGDFITYWWAAASRQSLPGVTDLFLQQTADCDWFGFFVLTWSDFKKKHWGFWVSWKLRHTAAVNHERRLSFNQPPSWILQVQKHLTSFSMWNKKPFLKLNKSNNFHFLFLRLSEVHTHFP